MSYDSRPDTQAHIQRVRELIQDMRERLYFRLLAHDATKLEEPELSLFNEWTPKLKVLTYGSDEYRAALRALRPALEHHYAAHSHHPEHFENGINGMSLLDLVEMFCDWKAAGERHADGNFGESLLINRERFGISPQLAEIFENTRKELDW
jgi:hypothetical protein